MGGRSTVLKVFAFRLPTARGKPCGVIGVVRTIRGGSGTRLAPMIIPRSDGSGGLAASGTAVRGMAHRRGHVRVISRVEGSSMPYEVAPLPYAYNALEPNIDELTMHLHHDRHYAGYVNNLNTAVEKHPELFRMSIADLLRNINTIPEDIRTAVRNQGGGAANHNLFFDIMGPNAGGQPTGPLADAINRTFSSFDQFKTQFSSTAAGIFGSGWAWLTVDPSGAITLESTPNQDNPLMSGRIPFFGLDVWEHAYYLKYYNVRADYIRNWWNVINWANVARRYEAALKGEFLYIV